MVPERESTLNGGLAGFWRFLPRAGCHSCWSLRCTNRPRRNGLSTTAPLRLARSLCLTRRALHKSAYAQWFLDNVRTVLPMALMPAAIYMLRGRTTGLDVQLRRTMPLRNFWRPSTTDATWCSAATVAAMTQWCSMQCTAVNNRCKVNYGNKLIVTLSLRRWSRLTVVYSKAIHSRHDTNHNIEYVNTRCHHWSWFRKCAHKHEPHRKSERAYIIKIN